MRKLIIKKSIYIVAVYAIAYSGQRKRVGKQDKEKKWEQKQEK